ncbi:MAG: DNA polymerase III subunit beta [Clostridia bacterium]|nr:DNA polymerase III subunit beta [Clostridia bacterium]
MKLLCNGLDLSDAVLKVVKAVSSKAVNPILEGIKLKAKEDYLLLSATDNELSIEKKIKADITEEGEVLVAGRLFADFVRKLNKDQIEINLINKQLKINYMDSEGILSCMNADDFPVLPSLTDTDYFTIFSKDFKELINKVIFSASTDDSRPILKGCLLEINGNKITSVALDGYRLALCNKNIISSSGDIKTVVPARCLSEISKFLSDDENELKIYIQKNHIMVNIDNTTITSRLLEGEFINYKMIIPGDFSSIVTSEKLQFEDSLERASILSKGDKNNLVKFDVKEKILTITSNSEEGNIKENILVDLKGKDILIAFNAKYFIEALKNIADDYITINFTSSVAPCIVQPVEGDEYLYLLLPVRIIN